MTRVAFYFFALIFISSCASREKVAFYQNIKELPNSVAEYNPQLKPDDLLLIIVSAPVAQAAADFNLNSYSVVGANTTGNIPESANAPLRYQSYLVDKNGNIEFPVLGQIKVGGLTRDAAITHLKDRLTKYINDPIVNLRILNFKITVQGEVARPGIFAVQTERVTLPEAVAMAGDMTIYGKRENVLIIRELDGERTYNFVDMTKSDFINSPFYYLSQNDLVYVEPNKTKMNSSVVGPNISVGLSALSLLITVVALLIR